MRRTLACLIALFLCFSIVFPSFAFAAFSAPGDTIVYTTRTGECYHEDGCRYLSKSKFETTLQSAIDRGYRACSVCRPPVLVSEEVLPDVADDEPQTVLDILAGGKYTGPASREPQGLETPMPRITVPATRVNTWTPPPSTPEPVVYKAKSPEPNSVLLVFVAALVVIGTFRALTFLASDRSKPQKPVRAVTINNVQNTIVNNITANVVTSPDIHIGQTVYFRHRETGLINWAKVVETPEGAVFYVYYNGKKMHVPYAVVGTKVRFDPREFYPKQNGLPDD